MSKILNILNAEDLISLSDSNTYSLNNAKINHIVSYFNNLRELDDVLFDVRNTAITNQYTTGIDIVSAEQADNMTNINYNESVIISGTIKEEYFYKLTSGLRSYLKPIEDEYARRTPRDITATAIHASQIYFTIDNNKNLIYNVDSVNRFDDQGIYKYVLESRYTLVTNNIAKGSALYTSMTNVLTSNYENIKSKIVRETIEEFRELCSPNIIFSDETITKDIIRAYYDLLLVVTKYVFGERFIIILGDILVWYSASKMSQTMSSLMGNKNIVNLKNSNLFVKFVTKSKISHSNQLYYDQEKETQFLKDYDNHGDLLSLNFPVGPSIRRRNYREAVLGSYVKSIDTIRHTVTTYNSFSGASLHSAAINQDETNEKRVFTNNPYLNSVANSGMYITTWVNGDEQSKTLLDPTVSYEKIPEDIILEQDGFSNDTSFQLRRGAKAWWTPMKLNITANSIKLPSKTGFLYEKFNNFMLTLASYLSSAGYSSLLSISLDDIMDDEATRSSYLDFVSSISTNVNDYDDVFDVRYFATLNDASDADKEDTEFHFNDTPSVNARSVKANNYKNVVVQSFIDSYALVPDAKRLSFMGSLLFAYIPLKHKYKVTNEKGESKDEYFSISYGNTKLQKVLNTNQIDFNLLFGVKLFSIPSQLLVTDPDDEYNQILVLELLFNHILKAGLDLYNGKSSSEIYTLRKNPALNFYYEFSSTVLEFCLKGSSPNLIKERISRAIEYLLNQDSLNDILADHKLHDDTLNYLRSIFIVGNRKFISDVLFNYIDEVSKASLRNVSFLYRSLTPSIRSVRPNKKSNTTN